MLNNDVLAREASDHKESYATLLQRIRHEFKPPPLRAVFCKEEVFRKEASEHCMDAPLACHFYSGIDQARDTDHPTGVENEET
jgi:hypothetical protein